MKPFMPTFAAAFPVAAAIACTGLHAQTRELGSSGILLDGVAALVDEGVVLKSELASRLALVIDNLRQQQEQLPPEQRAALPPLSVLESQVLEQLILEEIQLQRADRLGIQIGDDILNEALSAVAGQLGLTLEQLPAALAEENIDYAMYREDSRQDLIIRQLEQRDVLARIAITPRELDQCLQRTDRSQTSEFLYNISHILVGVSSAASSEELAAAQREVDEINERLAAGEDFGQLAVTFSDSPTALEGGALGWRRGAELPTLFAASVTRMAPGDVSEAIQSGSGFNLVRLNDMRGDQRVMVDQVRARHILITTNEILDDAAAMQRLSGIRDQILEGDDFSTIAQAVSEDAVSAADGGDLGWSEPDAYVPEFTEMLTTLPIGELSEPFQTRFGWHILEVLEHRSYDQTNDVKEQQCAGEIRAAKAEEEKAMWLRRLRDQAFIDTRL